MNNIEFVPEKPHVSSSPHLRTEVTTRRLMTDVCIAMLPALLWGVYHFGIYSLFVTAATVIACVLSEYAFEYFMGKPITIKDMSAVVTGMILALNMPPEIPVWIPMLGGVFAIIVVKQLYGGLGQNFMNPALAARCFLLISFAKPMTDFSVEAMPWATKVVDGVSGATPLAYLKAGGEVDLVSLLIGNIPGTIGEVSVIALLIGAAYLVFRKVISLRIPLSYILTVLVFTALFSGRGLDPYYFLCEICAGGLIFGAFFMATDYVTGPLTPDGQIVYGIVMGILTGLFRLFGGSAEGVSYAIILGNVLCPLIEKYTVPTAFGKGKYQKNKNKSAESKLNRMVVVKTFVITLVSGVLLGGVYVLTKEPIEAANRAALYAAYEELVPGASEYKDMSENEALAAAVENTNALLSADGTYGDVTVNNLVTATDESGNVMGYIVDVTDHEAYDGDIEITVGYMPDESGELKNTGISFLAITETAGLGMKAQNPEFKDQFTGKPAMADNAPLSLTVTKSGNAGDTEINAISGATVTSKAVTNAVNAANTAVNAAVSSDMSATFTAASSEALEGGNE